MGIGKHWPSVKLNNPESWRNTDINYTEGDWSVREYDRVGISNICHTHSSGTTHITPFGYSRDNEYGCWVCDEKAPLGVMVVWVLFNWDRALW